ncbi:hypothetical protein COY95_00155, partial [Candidatus Woesearchaeota archaeon CG_4_10_14_0_8_um_filter_47_5]
DVSIKKTSPDVWNYEYMVLENDTQGYFNVSLSAYNNSWSVLATDEVTGLRYTFINKTGVLASNGILYVTSNTFKTGNTDETETFTASGRNASLLLYLPRFANVTYAKLRLVGQVYNGGYPQNVTLDFNGGVADFEVPGKLGANLSPDLKSELNSKIAGCTQGGDGFCNIPVNISTAGKGRILIDSLDIRYTLNESGVFNRSAWWKNESGFMTDASKQVVRYYNRLTNPTENINVTGFEISRFATECEINNTLLLVKNQNGKRYCALPAGQTLLAAGGGTWKDHMVWDDYSSGEPVIKEMEFINLKNVALASNNGYVVNVSSWYWAPGGAIDGDLNDVPNDAWASNSSQGDSYPWITIGFNQSYYVSYLKIANRQSNGFNQVLLLFSDGSTKTTYLPNNQNL